MSDCTQALLNMAQANSAELRKLQAEIDRLRACNARSDLNELERLRELDHARDSAIEECLLAARVWLTEAFSGEELLDAIRALKSDTGS